MHDQFSVSSCRFKPNMQQFQHKNKDSVILFYTNVVLIFSHLFFPCLIFFQLFLTSRLPFSISYGSRVFPKAWTHRAQSFGSHQSAAEMGDRNPSDWLHVQPAMEAKYAKWKRGAGFGWGFFEPKKKFQKQSSHHFHIIISKNHPKITHIFWLLQHLISSRPLTPRSSCIAA